jgi:hypothetical protein
MIEVVGILIAAGDGEHAGAQDVRDAVRHQPRIASVGDQRREPRGEADRSLGGSEQQHPAVRGQPPPVERRGDFLAPDGWEIERQQRILGHGGCGSRGGVDKLVSTPNS